MLRSLLCSVVKPPVWIPPLRFSFLGSCGKVAFGTRWARWFSAEIHGWNSVARGEQSHPNSTQPIHFSQAPATSMEIPSLHGSMFATVSRPTELNLATHSNTQQGWFMMNMLEYAFKVLPGDEGFHQGCPNSWMVHYMERPKIKWMISLGLPPFEETYIYIYTHIIYIYIYIICILYVYE